MSALLSEELAGSAANPVTAGAVTVRAEAHALAPLSQPVLALQPKPRTTIDFIPLAMVTMVGGCGITGLLTMWLGGPLVLGLYGLTITVLVVLHGGLGPRDKRTGVSGCASPALASTVGGGDAPTAR